MVRELCGHGATACTCVFEMSGCAWEMSDYLDNCTWAISTFENKPMGHPPPSSLPPDRRPGGSPNIITMMMMRSTTTHRQIYTIILHIKTAPPWAHHHNRLEGRRNWVVMLCVEWYLVIFYREKWRRAHHKESPGSIGLFSVNTSSDMTYGGLFSTAYKAQWNSEGFTEQPQSSEKHR